MQDTPGEKNPSNAGLIAVESALTKQRLTRFQDNPTDDLSKAIAIYLWNCRLAQAFIFPLHVCEVAVRNAIQGGLRVRFANPWYSQEEFTRLLDPRHAAELTRIVDEERSLQQSRLTDDHIVSSLAFGFWEHLTTKRFDRTLWLRGIKHNFPNAFSAGLTIRDVNGQIQTVRQWRNRVTHHRVLFDREPERKLREILTLIEWRCTYTAAWVREHEQVTKTLQDKPINPGADSKP